MDRVLDFDEIQEVIDKFTEMLILANRMGNVSDILDKFNIDFQQYAACDYNSAKILVIGYSNVNVVDLKRIIKKFRLNENMFEFILNENVENYPMNSLKNNYRYSDIFVGPMPHKTKGMGDCSSIIAHIKNHQTEYPKLTELKDANCLKISAQSFRCAIETSELLKMRKNTKVDNYG